MSPRNGLARFRSEVKRWNDSINLVSRHGTEARIDALSDQCVQALCAWRNHGGALGLTLPERSVLYLDLGSGGGFPAAMWHEEMAGAGADLRTVLVEPRAKRAWFLERVARLLASPTPEVLAGRWGEVDVPSTAAPELVVISLKALRLTDATILEGLALFLAAGARPDVAIARFHPEDQIWSDDLVTSLGIPEAGAEVEGDQWRAKATVAGLVGARGSSLVVSRYGFSRF